MNRTMLTIIISVSNPAVQGRILGYIYCAYANEVFNCVLNSVRAPM